jgi:hypothetical protein
VHTLNCDGTHKPPPEIGLCLFFSPSASRLASLLAPLLPCYQHPPGPTPGLSTSAPPAPLPTPLRTPHPLPPPPPPYELRQGTARRVTSIELNPSASSTSHLPHAIQVPLLRPLHAAYASRQPQWSSNALALLATKLSSCPLAQLSQSLLSSNLFPGGKSLSLHSKKAQPLRHCSQIIAKYQTCSP